MNIFSRMFRSLCTFLLWPAVMAFAAFKHVAYRPDAATALLLDASGLVDVPMETRRSQFTAFLKRALTHLDFRGDHFDPGRLPA